MLASGNTSPCHDPLHLFAKTVESQHAGIVQQLSDRALSGPIVAGALNGRISAVHVSDNGYFHNDYTGGNVDPYEEESVQGRLIFDKGDGLRVDLKARLGKINAGAIYSNAQLEPFDINSTNIPYQQDVNGHDIQKRLDFSLKADYNLKFANLSVIGAYARQHEIYYGDGPFNSLLVTDPAAFFSMNPLPLYGFSSLPNDGTQLTLRNQHDYSFETRLTSNSKRRFRWIVGAYYTNIDRKSGQETGLDNGPGIVIPELLVTDIHSVNPTSTLLYTEFKTKAYAVYVQTQFDILDNVTLSAAARYDKESRSSTNLVPNIDSPASILEGNPTPLTAFSGLVRKASFSRIQPEYSLRYSPSRSLSAYVSYGEGFRSGGFNASGSTALIMAKDDPNTQIKDQYPSEISKSFETGFKSQLFENRASLNGSLFYMHIYNAQDFFFYPNSLARVIGSIDKVRSKGLELNAAYKIMDGLTISVNGAYTDTKIEKYTNFPDYVGNRVPETPLYTLDTTLDYTVPVRADMSLNTHVDYRRTGSFWESSSNTPGTERNPVNLVNGRIALSKGPYTLALWAKNILDVSYNSGGTVVGTLLNYPYRAPPRTFAGELTFKF